jgi:betaine-aldehyde dehydrogenase
MGGHMNSQYSEMQRGLFIGGRWVAGDGPSLPVIDPCTEQELVSVDTASNAQVDIAVQRALAAQREMRNVSGAVRAEWLRQLAALVVESKERLAELESRNVGKPYTEALLDVDDTVTCLEYYATLAADADARQDALLAEPFGDFEVRVRHEPVGVSALIIPWNFPLLTSVWKLAPALAAGCASILKPSEYTPLTALALADLIGRMELPPGLVSVLNGRGPAVGEALCRHPGVAKISFTGSTETGRRIAGIAAEQYKRLTVEGGGKSPIIVFADTPVEAAVEWILFGAFYNQGEVCNATTRVLLEKQIHDAVLERVCAEARKLKIGAPGDSSTQMGPLQNRPQFDKFMRYVAKGSADGARLLCGGDRHPDHPHGYFVRPAVFDAVPVESSIWREEVFGPLLSIRSFSSEAEAVSVANDSEFGLAAAVLSVDADRSQRVAKALDAGCVWINCSGPAFVQGPWGGFKRSGIGRELGRWGLEGYLETKQVTRYRSSKPWGWYLKGAPL